MDKSVDREMIRGLNLPTAGSTEAEFRQVGIGNVPAVGQLSRRDRWQRAKTKATEHVYGFLATLVEIHRDRLWDEEYESFEECCRDLWGIGRRQAYHRLKHADVLKNLGFLSDEEDKAVSATNECTRVHSQQDTPPPTERQARELASLPVEEQLQAWREAVQQTGGQPTTKAVKQTAKQRKRPKRRTKKPDPKPKKSKVCPTCGRPYQ